MPDITTQPQAKTALLVPGDPAPQAAKHDAGPAVRLPPYDEEAEMSTLGSMLQDRESIGLVLQIIPRDESRRFYHPAHRLLYETLLDLYDTNKPVDLVVLEEELRRRKMLEEIGGREYLLDLNDSVPHHANCEHYARIVRDKSLLRDLIRCGTEITSAAYEHAEEVSAILDDAEKRLFAVTEQRVSNHAVALRDQLIEFWGRMQSDEPGVTGVPTGFSRLDEMLGGLQFGDLIIVAGRPSMGKTAFGLSLLEYMGIQNEEHRVPCAFFSMEMSRQQVTQRLLCSRACVDMNSFRHRRLGPDEIRRLQMACDEMMGAKVYVDDTPGMSVMELRAKARRMKMLHDVQVIFVDYLQLMHDRSAREGRQQEISAISRQLKALGRELNVPIVAMAQLNRQVEGRSTNRPRMSDLRESGAIEQDADVIMLLHREEYYRDKAAADGDTQMDDVRGKAEIIIDKQRNGPTGVVELHFTARYARFDENAPPYISEAEVPAGRDDYVPDATPRGFGGYSGGEDDTTPF